MQLTTNTAGRAGLLQHIFDFVGPEAGIDGDQHHAGQSGAELEHDPFGQIVRPYRDPLAGPESRKQSARGALSFRIKFRIRPLAAKRRVGDARRSARACPAPTVAACSSNWPSVISRTAGATGPAR